MNHLHLKRRRWLIASSALTGLAATGMGPSALAQDGSSYDETWHDPKRSRDVPVRVRVPQRPGPWPVVIYSHGLGGNREGGDAWGTAWGDAGMLVLHVQHAGSDSAVWRQGLAALRAAANAQQLIDRVADVRFVLDDIERRQRTGVSPWRHARLDRIGMAGHSFGARTTQALAGERFIVPTQMFEPRLKAFIALSPSCDARLPPAQAFAAITEPFLAITGSLDGDPFGAFSTGESRERVYQGLPPGQRALLWLDGADHMSFSGNVERRISGRGPLLRQPLAQERETAHHALVARCTTLWWQWRLGVDAAAWDELQRLPGLGERDRLQLG